jgi:hypothetical protein
MHQAAAIPIAAATIDERLGHGRPAGEGTSGPPLRSVQAAARVLPRGGVRLLRGAVLSGLQPPTRTETTVTATNKPAGEC